jgi:hypothetical protein
VSLAIAANATGDCTIYEVQSLGLKRKDQKNISVTSVVSETTVY